MHCPICGGALRPAFKVAFPDAAPGYKIAWDTHETPCVAHWHIARCSECGLGVPDPMPTEAEIVEYYANQPEPNEWEIQHYVKLSRDKAAGWDAFAARLTRLHGGPGRLLEVGCAAGHLLAAAQAHGWEVMGVEASPKFSREVERRGIPVHPGTLRDFTGGNYDVIVMTDVIEHLQDPLADLGRCHNILRPSGLLVVATLDIDSLAARYYGLKWRQIVISHTFYWTRRSLSLAFTHSGFDVSAVSSVRYWDPDRGLERRRQAREFAKLVTRKLLQTTWMPAAARSRRLAELQRRVTGLDYDALWMKVGDQAVMSDVALIVGRAR